MRNLKALILILLLIPAHYSYSQNDEQAAEYLSKAKSALRYKDYNKAEDFLLKSIYYNPNKYQVHLILGDLYSTQKKYKQASKCFSVADSLHPVYYINYKLANSLFYQGKYHQAKKHYQTYIDGAPKGNKGIAISQKRIKNCDFAIKAMENPVNFNPVNLGPGINTTGFEYNPVVSSTGEMLIYTGIRMKNGRRVEDFFISSLNDSVWSRGIPLPGSVNSNENEGAHCISMDGRFLYFTSCGREEGLGSCDIYVSVRRGGNWSEPINLGRGINSVSWDAHPAISPDGKTIVFSSTRKGGKGGKDLWYSTFKDGRWTEPNNISQLNTEGNEVTPFIHADGKTMYFSSDGLMGMGGTDFFVTTFDINSQRWCEPVNLGYSINSSGDEYSLTVAKNGKTAYFASDALDGFGEMDIYSFELDENISAGVTSYLSGEIFDIVSKKKVLNSEISIVDLESSQHVETISYDEGNYSALLANGKNYAAIISSPDHLLFSESFFFESDSTSSTINKDFYLTRIRKGKRMNLNNIFFESGKYKILEASYFELDMLLAFLQKHSEYNIKVIGYTDNVGSQSDNQILSVKRATSVMNYLIEGGLKASRIKAFGRGETKPVSDNSTEEGRRRNRRTEILLY